MTGAGGFIGSWIVRFLLGQGKTVRATVRATDDATLASKYPHLLAMRDSHPAGRLTLHAAPLLGDGAQAGFQAVFAGCSGVYHCASPFFFASDKPEEELIKPAVEGTQNVLRAAIAAKSVKRVVMTSSVAAVYIGTKPADHWYTEADWSDLEVVRATKQWYAESKLLSEREAWRIMGAEVGGGAGAAHWCVV